MKSKASEAVSSSLSKLKSNSKAHRKLGSTNSHLFDRDEWKYHSMQRIPTVDSSSEISSIFSGSDVSSCSTASTKDSSRSEDFSDFIFGEMGPGWYSRYGIPSDPVVSSTSYQNLDADSEVEHGVVGGNGWREDYGKVGKPSVLYSDSIKHRRNLSQQFLSSSRSDIDHDQIDWTNPSNVRLRRSTDGRSAQTFY